MNIGHISTDLPWVTTGKTIHCGGLKVGVIHQPSGNISCYSNDCEVWDFVGSLWFSTFKPSLSSREGGHRYLGMIEGEDFIPIVTDGGWEDDRRLF